MFATSRLDEGRKLLSESEANNSLAAEFEAMSENEVRVFGPLDLYDHGTLFLFLCLFLKCKFKFVLVLWVNRKEILC